MHHPRRVGNSTQEMRRICHVALYVRVTPSPRNIFPAIGGPSATGVEIKRSHQARLNLHVYPYTPSLKINFKGLELISRLTSALYTLVIIR